MRTKGFNITNRSNKYQTETPNEKIMNKNLAIKVVT